MKQVIRRLEDRYTATVLLVLALLALLVVIFTAGCASVNQTTVTLTSVVDSAMKNWAQASVAGQTSPALDAQVKAAHEQYRAVCGAIVPVYETALANGQAPDAAAVLRTLRAAVDPLLNLLVPLLPAPGQTQLNAQLRKVNAP